MRGGRARMVEVERVGRLALHGVRTWATNWRVRRGTPTVTTSPQEASRPAAIALRSVPGSRGSSISTLLYTPLRPLGKSRGEVDGEMRLSGKVPTRQRVHLSVSHRGAATVTCDMRRGGRPQGNRRRPGLDVERHHFAEAGISLGRRLRLVLQPARGHPPQAMLSALLWGSARNTLHAFPCCDGVHIRKAMGQCLTKIAKFFAAPGAARSMWPGAGRVIKASPAPREEKAQNCGRARSCPPQTQATLARPPRRRKKRFREAVCARSRLGQA